MNDNGRIVATFTSPIDAGLLRAALDAVGDGGTVLILAGRPPKLAVCEPPARMEGE